MDKKFLDSYRLCPVDEEWAGVLERYCVNGYHPGSFFESVLANDLSGAAHRTHPSNQWEEIVKLMKWLQQRAPSVCWGSYEKVQAWIDLTNDQRRAILEADDLLMSPWDHLKEKETV
jgi:hypothetical protein